MIKYILNILLFVSILVAVIYNYDYLYTNMKGIDFFIFILMVGIAVYIYCLFEHIILKNKGE